MNGLLTPRLRDARRRGGGTFALAMLALGWAPCDETPRQESVGAEAALFRTDDALMAGALQAINGTYGPQCAARDGDWSLLVSGSGPLLHPPLSVVRGSADCELAITSLVADQTYTAVTPIALAGSYPLIATGFRAGGVLAFGATAMIDSTSFDDDFAISLRIAGNPSTSEESVGSGHHFLGAAATFALVAGTTITSSGLTEVTGDIGVSSPGTGITGVPPATVREGSIHIGDAAADQAQADVLPAYLALAAQPCGTNLDGQDLGGRSLSPGVYCFTAAAALTGELILDAEGDPDGVFVFQIGSTLTTASYSSVVMANEGLVRNVSWQVGSAVTVGTYSDLLGNLLVFTSVTFTTGASLTGRALVRAAVTMDTNWISVPTPL